MPLTATAVVVTFDRNIDPSSLVEASNARENFDPGDTRGRQDITGDLVITIDPPDAKDFDDAICLQRLGKDRWKLWVHIADVSHYVRPDNLLDREAQRRGNSTYLVDRVIPMLPERLSGELCSLRPKEDRLTKSVFASLDPVAQVKGVPLHNRAPEGLAVWGDPFLLRQALTNLVQNAIDFSPRGAPVEVAAMPAGRDVELSVRDRGPGIPDFALDRVFEKFYSLRRPDTGKKSTGLGLSFVREIAQLHRGAAALANHPEGGAVATLRLPAFAASR